MPVEGLEASLRLPPPLFLVSLPSNQVLPAFSSASLGSLQSVSSAASPPPGFWELGKRMGVRQCQVCEEVQSKYKCPICLIPYCSLACYKKHKEVPCARPSIPEPKLVVIPERPLQVDKQDWQLQKKQYELLASSDEIRDALTDGKLREIICKIDSSTNGYDELEKAMEEEPFREFTDKILSIVG